MKVLGNVIKRMNYAIYSQQNMLHTSFILVNLMLSLCPLEYGVIENLRDEGNNSGITEQWDNRKCPDTWSIASKVLRNCYPKISGKMNCTVFSLLYDVSEVKELYVNIKTETRKCANLKEKYSSCTGKFNVLVNYEINKNSFKRFDLPGEIPKKNPSSGPGDFYETDDNISFSVDQNYKSLKLGFQGPFYCGRIKSVSVYYYLCPVKTNALVDFTDVPAPNKSSSPYTHVGICTRNAVKKNRNHPLSMKCYYNGTVEVFGGCECEAGYTKKNNLCKGLYFFWCIAL